MSHPRGRFFVSNATRMLPKNIAYKKVASVLWLEFSQASLATLSSVDEAASKLNALMRSIESFYGMYGFYYTSHMLRPHSYRCPHWHANYPSARLVYGVRYQL